MYNRTKIDNRYWKSWLKDYEKFDLAVHWNVENVRFCKDIKIPEGDQNKAIVPVNEVVSKDNPDLKRLLQGILTIELK